MKHSNTTLSPITVTSPLLPDLKELIPYLEDIWSRKWLTNNGFYHELLEKELCTYLGVRHISLFANGTLALMAALQALKIKGEVITTPYSFVATTHSLWWNSLIPVFVDINPDTYNIDVGKIERAITSRTSAIMPVHVYGVPCDILKIQSIADQYGLKVIYDAAHAFGVQQNGVSILNAGDLSILSFHATKVFSTIEGGAIICHTPEMKHHIDNLKNFGFRGETVVEEPGINAKLNELQCAFGLVTLKKVNEAIGHRRKITEFYLKELNSVVGLRIGSLPEDTITDFNYSYFPIFVNENEFGMSRDCLYEKLREHGVLGRRYFYPLISSFAPYCHLPSAKKENLPVANKTAQEVICLPIYADLELSQVAKVVDIIKNKV